MVLISAPANRGNVQESLSLSLLPAATAMDVRVLTLVQSTEERRVSAACPTYVYEFRLRQMSRAVHPLSLGGRVSQPSTGSSSRQGEGYGRVREEVRADCTSRAHVPSACSSTDTYRGRIKAGQHRQGEKNKLTESSLFSKRAHGRLPELSSTHNKQLVVPYGDEIKGLL